MTELVHEQLVVRLWHILVAFDDEFVCMFVLRFACFNHLKVVESCGKKCEDDGRNDRHHFLYFRYDLESFDIMKMDVKDI